MKHTIKLTKRNLKRVILESINQVLTKDSLFNELWKYEIGSGKYFVESAPEEIEKAFGCDPSKHKFTKYGIDYIRVEYDDNIRVEMSKYPKHFIYCSNFGEGEKKVIKGETMVTYKLHLPETLEKLVRNYFLKLIDEKKKLMGEKNKLMDKNKYYFEHFEENLENYLQIAKQYLKKINEKEGEDYKAYLTKGNSLSNKRVDSVIVITNNDYQVGYIRIIPYEDYGYIKFDSCYLGGSHTSTKMDVMSNPKEYVENACRWAI